MNQEESTNPQVPQESTNEQTPPQPNSPEIPTTPSPVPQKSSKRISPLTLVIGILVLLIIAFAGGVGYWYMQSIFQTATVPETTPRMIEEEQEDPAIQEEEVPELVYIQDDPQGYNPNGATRFFLAEYADKLYIHQTSRSLHPRVILPRADENEVNYLWGRFTLQNTQQETFVSGASYLGETKAYPLGVRLLRMFQEYKYATPDEIKNVMIGDGVVSFDYSPDRSLVMITTSHDLYAQNREDPSILYSEDRQYEYTAWLGWRAGSSYQFARMSNPEIMPDGKIPILHSMAPNNTDLAIALAECWNCGGHLMDLVVARVENGSITKIMNIGRALEFTWLTDGRYQYKEAISTECTEFHEMGPCIVDLDALPYKTGTLD